MSKDSLDAKTINRITRSFAHAFDSVKEEPATGEVAGVLAVSVDSGFRVSRVSLARDLVGDDLRERIESAIATATNAAYQQMTTRHADALRATVMEVAPLPKHGPKIDL
jgi:DNA-binding protein YbaB